jgi:RNA polymerase sigma factor FliA
MYMRPAAADTGFDPELPLREIPVRNGTHPMKLDTKRSGRLSPEQALALWAEYRKTGDSRVRDRLIMTFAPLVKYIVFKKIRELPARCEVEDFISCGLEALIASIDRYDPEKGATLEQYAWTRIHGAVLDELRRQDWAPRSLRRWERDIARAREQFVAVHNRRPTREELAAALGTTSEELATRQQEIQTSEVTSLNTLVISDDDTTIERIDTLVSDDNEYDPEHASARMQAKELFRRAFEKLPQRERELAVLLYVKNLTLREVGDILGVSESRVCQIHGQLKRRLRDQLGSEESLFSEVA